MENLELSVADRVARITSNRPKVRKDLHPAAFRELSKVCDRIEEDDEIWAAVLTGAGGPEAAVACWLSR